MSTLVWQFGRRQVTLMCLTLLLVESATAQPGAQPRRAPAAPPRLVVMIVVDQMRADYVDRFRSDWTGGFQRLLTTGARFTNTAYPYLATYTCPGHATIATGAFPHVHGVFQNTWFDRERQEIIPCTRDDGAKATIYSGTGDEAFGPGLLTIPTFADRMREQRKARIVTLSLKARSAIMLAGHGAESATWLTEAFDGFQTSSRYSERPVPAVKAYVDAHSIDADHGAVWQRLLPAARYPEPDAPAAEAPPAAWTAGFPHPLDGSGGRPDRQYRDRWQRSPFADAYLGRMAASLAETLQLGRPGTTDVLAVSFSSPDLVGHPFGPHSQEVRDVYARLDRTLGELFTRLDALVGRDQYVVALSADHGVADLPEQLMQRGLSGGRVQATAVRDAVEAAAVAALGPGTYVARVNTNDVYFLPGVYGRLLQQPGALEAIIRAVTAIAGIERVFRSEDVARWTDDRDRVRRAAALSYVPNRSGDLIIATKAGWTFSATGTTHGSANPDDQRVPLLFMGHGIRPGTYTDAVTPADLAPTLAAIVGITLPHAEGRALTMALRPSVPRTPK